MSAGDIYIYICVSWGSGVQAAHSTLFYISYTYIIRNYHFLGGGVNGCSAQTFKHKKKHNAFCTTQ